jgi:hypothetical protein
MAAKYLQGFFKPQNPQKYKGNPTNIIYRSSWELKAMLFFDKNPSILEWKSEEVIIPYRSPKDNLVHRYFPDFWVRLKTKTGTEDHLIEVKPHSQCLPPVKKNKVTKSFINEIVTFEVNQAKWNSAKEFCKNRNMKFTILNEYDLGIKKN